MDLHYLQFCLQYCGLILIFSVVNLKYFGFTGVKIYIFNIYRVVDLQICWFKVFWIYNIEYLQDCRFTVLLIYKIVDTDMLIYSFVEMDLQDCRIFVLFLIYICTILTIYSFVDLHDCGYTDMLIYS